VHVAKTAYGPPSLAGRLYRPLEVCAGLLPEESPQPCPRRSGAAGTAPSSVASALRRRPAGSSKGVDDRQPFMARQSCTRRTPRLYVRGARARHGGRAPPPPLPRAQTPPLEACQQEALRTTSAAGAWQCGVGPNGPSACRNGASPPAGPASSVPGGQGEAAQAGRARR